MRGIALQMVLSSLILLAVTMALLLIGAMALIIGNRDYEGDTPDVNYALNDMEDFATLFRKVAGLSATDFRTPQVAHCKTDEKNGLFGWYILRGLDGEADAYGDGDGKISLTELHDYVRVRVVRHTFGIGSQQTPSPLSEGGPVLVEFGGQAARPVFDVAVRVAAGVDDVPAFQRPSRERSLSIGCLSRPCARPTASPFCCWSRARESRGF